MGDFENKVATPVVVKQPLTLQQAAAKVVRSFEQSALDGKFMMTVRQGAEVQRALIRVWKALENLENVTKDATPKW